jgi:hypothetical protein
VGWGSYKFWFSVNTVSMPGVVPTLCHFDEDGVHDAGLGAVRVPNHPRLSGRLSYGAVAAVRGLVFGLGRFVD